MGVIVVKGGKVIYKNTGGQIDGEKMPGDLNSWCLYSQDINEALNSSYGILTERSSTLFHSYAPVSSAINKTTAYAIGSGNIFRSHPDHRILGITQEAAREWGKKFQLLVHYTFENLNWYEKQAITFRGALINGDALVFFIRDENGLDLVEAGGNNIDWEYAKTDSWTLGIRHDKLKRRKGIYTNRSINFKNQKTGDQQVIQFFLKSMPRQLRGLPLAYKIIALAKNHDRQMDATVQRAVLESIMFGYSNTDTTDFGKQAQQQAAAASRKKSGGALSRAWSRITGTRDLAGGNIYQLKNGESMQFTKLETPGSNFDKFQEWMIKFVAMATDVTPGIILSEYPTSYSSHRGEFNDFWKMVQAKRHSFNKTVNKVVIREIAKKLILNGTIKATGFFNDPLIQSAWMAGSFLGPVPGHINPLQEVKAQEVAVKNSFQLRSNVAALYENEWDNTVNQWGEEERTFKTLPLTEQEKLIQEDLQNVE